MNLMPQPTNSALRSERPQPATAPVISLRDIGKTFYRGPNPLPVLHNITFDIYPGEFVAIMGASGSGKSTLMNLIGLLDRPTAGSYLFDGQEVSSLDADHRALLRREAFGFIFQQYNLLPNETATSNVAMPAVYAGMTPDARTTRAVSLLTTLGLGDRTDHRPSQLSGGQQQRVSIARALMNGGAVILADEPTGALDSKSGQEVMQLLADLNARGHTVLVITHDRDVARHTRRIIEIKDGHIVADDAVPHEGKRADTAMSAGLKPSHPRRNFYHLFDAVEAARMALHALRSNMLRTLLTLLGIIIGVASVVAMLAIGNGAKQSVLDRISAMGTNLLLVRPGAPNIRQSGGVTATLVPADSDAIAELPNVRVSVPEYPGNVTLRSGNRDYVTQVNATSARFPEARDWPAVHGLFFSEADVKSYAPVAAIGQTVARNMFGEDVDPVGKFLLINNIPFQVVGVMAPKGATPWGADQDDIVYVPLTTGMLRLFGQRYVRTVTVQVEDVSRIDETQEQIRQLLITRHKAEDFQIRNMASIIDTAMETQNTLTLLLGSIAAISLLVGGIGVMNIMMVSVTERTREIGVRMATGARRRNIMMQFSSEALAICTLGGAIGVLVGLSTTWLFAYFGRPVMYSVEPVLLAFFCAFATGLVFGYLPARKAADLDPVVALASD